MLQGHVPTQYLILSYVAVMYLRMYIFNFFRHRNEEVKYQTLPVKPKRMPSSKRLPSDERPSKRLKWTTHSSTQCSIPPSQPNPTSYFTLPHRKEKSQKVAKTASFHFSSPFSSKQHANPAPVHGIQFDPF